jgi:hypothetical protein
MACTSEHGCINAGAFVQPSPPHKSLVETCVDLNFDFFERCVELSSNVTFKTPATFFDFQRQWIQLTTLLTLKGDTH